MRLVPDLMLTVAGWTSGRGVTLAGGRIAFVTRASCTGAPARLALIDLRGRMQRLAPPLLSSGPFDYDGRRLAYAYARRDDTGIRVVDVGKP